MDHEYEVPFAITRWHAISWKRISYAAVVGGAYDIVIVAPEPSRGFAFIVVTLLLLLCLTMTSIKRRREREVALLKCSHELYDAEKRLIDEKTKRQLAAESAYYKKRFEVIVAQLTDHDAS